ncbi:hypothetical protein TRVL_02028 [Trypanosoma vivax]|nr:hypothetical protein TRVL_02028 [Trypanosoma vivax]
MSVELRGEAKGHKVEKEGCLLGTTYKSKRKHCEKVCPLIWMGLSCGSRRVSDALGGEIAINGDGKSVGTALPAERSDFEARVVSGDRDGEYSPLKGEGTDATSTRDLSARQKRRDELKQVTDEILAELFRHLIDHHCGSDCVFAQMLLNRPGVPTNGPDLSPQVGSGDTQVHKEEVHCPSVEKSNSGDAHECVEAEKNIKQNEKNDEGNDEASKKKVGVSEARRLASNNPSCMEKGSEPACLSCEGGPCSTCTPNGTSLRTEAGEKGTCVPNCSLHTGFQRSTQATNNTTAFVSSTVGPHETRIMSSQCSSNSNNDQCATAAIADAERSPRKCRSGGTLSFCSEVSLAKENGVVSDVSIHSSAFQTKYNWPVASGNGERVAIRDRRTVRRRSPLMSPQQSAMGDCAWQRRDDMDNKLEYRSTLVRSPPRSSSMQCEERKYNAGGRELATVTNPAPVPYNKMSHLKTAQALQTHTGTPTNRLTRPSTDGVEDVLAIERLRLYFQRLEQEGEQLACREAEVRMRACRRLISPPNKGASSSTCKILMTGKDGGASLPMRNTTVPLPSAAVEELAKHRQGVNSARSTPVVGYCIPRWGAAEPGESGRPVTPRSVLASSRRVSPMPREVRTPLPNYGAGQMTLVHRHCLNSQSSKDLPPPRSCLTNNSTREVDTVNRLDEHAPVLSSGGRIGEGAPQSAPSAMLGSSPRFHVKSNSVEYVVVDREEDEWEHYGQGVRGPAFSMTTSTVAYDHGVENSCVEMKLGDKRLIGNPMRWERSVATPAMWSVSPRFARNNTHLGTHPYCGGNKGESRKRYVAVEKVICNCLRKETCTRCCIHGSSVGYCKLHTDGKAQGTANGCRANLQQGGIRVSVRYEGDASSTVSGLWDSGSHCRTTHSSPLRFAVPGTHVA